VPLTVPEVRRLLRLLTEPAAHHGFHLDWSSWRRAHQAVARRGHIAARARGQPIRARPTAANTPPMTTAPPPAVHLTEAHWARIRPLLPAPAAVGRPPADARIVLAGVLRVLHTHASWRALPVDFGPWPTVYSRYRQWRLTDLWPRLLHVLQDSTITAK
jgi:putative transposase of IS4/5 family DUF4096